MIYNVVSRSVERVQITAHKESNFRISAWEYDAPTTMSGSADLEETFLGLLGLLRQNGEALLLKVISESLCRCWKAQGLQTC